MCSNFQGYYGANGSLSPAAQAVLDAATNVKHPEIEMVEFQCSRLEIAAALRAAALYCKRDSAILLSLADDLEGSD